MWDSKGEALRIFNPGFKWRQVVSSIPGTLHSPGKKKIAGSHWIEDRMVLRACMNVVKK
jgi:hypothetical protein